jgi:hypothetical protein
VEVRRGVSPEVVLAQLLKHTRLQQRFSGNMVALVGGTPRTLGLKDCLQHFLEFRWGWPLLPACPVHLAHQQPQPPPTYMCHMCRMDTPLRHTSLPTRCINPHLHTPPEPHRLLPAALKTPQA